MKIFHGDAAARTLADPQTFAGEAHVKKLGSATEGVPVVVYHVEFEAGGRTNWHTHSGPQWLLVIDGRVRVQKWGEAAVDVASGDTIVIEPREKHWHGAAPGSRGVHLAVNVDVSTEWLEPVSDGEYAR